MSMTIEECNTPQAHRPPLPTPNTPSNVLEQFLLKDRVAIITGAADGIGLAVAQAYAEAGCSLALWYNTNDAAVKHAESLAAQHKVKASAYQVEVSDPAKVEAAVKQVEQEFGRIDIMVANAGMAISKGILETSVDEYKRQMAVNVDGVVYCAKYAGEVFKRQGTGNLIVTSSISAHIVNVPVDQPVVSSVSLHASILVAIAEG
jgi:sorbose reductase